MKLEKQKPHRGILINKIPARGIGGLIFAIGIVAIFLVGVPAFRPLAPFILVGGVLAGALLYYWRNQTRW